MQAVFVREIFAMRANQHSGIRFIERIQ
jgi:hypothetical protein